MESLAPDTKQCAYCKEHKPRTEYTRSSSRKDGLASRCRTCQNAFAHGLIPRRPGHPERFWNKVDAADCWEWTASLYLGYGMYMLNGRVRFAHRVAWELLVGPIAPGLELDHLCRNRKCVNPDHLEPVTHVVNTMRGYSFFAMQARRTHCPQGHPYAGDNLFHDNNGNRRCRACSRAQANKQTRKKQALRLAQ